MPASSSISSIERCTYRTFLSLHRDPAQCVGDRAGQDDGREDGAEIPEHKVEHRFAAEGLTFPCDLFLDLFHTDDLRVRRPPYSDRWRWCGSGDVEFQSRWPESLRPLMPFDAVHLGQPEVNWCGRSERYFDGSLPELGHERLENMRALRRQLRINAGLDDRYQGDRI